ncbi:MAG: DNA translocase FtsK, partial [Planctomycetota bacterium]
PADEVLAPARAAESPPEPTAHPLADPIVTIPRPEVQAASGAPDEALMREAVELVLTSRRANAVFLQRKLRVDYDLATAVLHQLAARGIVALDAEATHGRILV